MEWEENFRAQLRARREASGESQSALAKRITASGLAFYQPTVQRIEDGERPVRLDEAHVIASVLGTNVETMTKSSDPFAEAESPEVVALGRSWGAVQRQVDDALYKLTGLAGQLDHFATLIEAHPEAADALWGADGENDWVKWIKWTVSSLTRYSSNRVVMSSDERYDELVRALESVARGVVAKPTPADLANAVEFPDEEFGFSIPGVIEPDHGER